MTVRNYVNRLTNARGVTADPANPTSVRNWGARSDTVDHSGGGAGQFALSNRSLTGGPSALCPSYLFVIRPAPTGNPATDIGTLSIQWINLDGLTLATPGESFTASIIALVPTGVEVRLWMRWETTDPFNPVEQYGGVTIADGSTWQEVSYQGIVPAGAIVGGSTSVNAQFRKTGGTVGLPAGTYKASGASFVVNDDPSAPYSGGYFDGAFTDLPAVSYDWLGDVWDSASLASVYTPDPTPATAPTAGSAIPVPTTPIVGRTYKKLPLYGYTVNEESTPIDASDQSGAVGQITLTTRENDQSRLLDGVPLDLIVPDLGTTRGTMRTPAGQDGVVTIKADSRLYLLIPKRTAQPFIGTLKGAILYYLELVNITTDIDIDDQYEDIDVVFLGWTDSVWFQLKKMLTGYNAEISLVSNNVVVRPVRQFTTANYRDESNGWSQDATQLALAIEVYQYQSEHLAAGLAYPAGGWSEGLEIFTVKEAETRTFPLEISASMISVVQPECVFFVDRYEVTDSVYAVVGNDDLPIPVDEWLDGGGALVVEINPDTKGLTVTITGATGTNHSPFRIAMSSGDSTDYSSLRIIGNGIFYDKVLYRRNTSADPDLTQQEVQTLDSEFIQTDQQRDNAIMWMRKRYGATREVISVTSRGVNRRGITGSYVRPTADDFNAFWDAYMPGAEMDDFNAEYAGLTADEFNALWNARVQNQFANQAFGNVGGARRAQRDMMYRIRSVTFTPATLSYTAEDDTIADDFNTVWDGMTADEFNAEWNLMQPGAVVADFNLRPLRRV